MLFEPTLSFFSEMRRLKILIEATLLVGFLSVISASIVDKKTLIALCIISGPSSPTNFLFGSRAPSCGELFLVISVGIDVFKIYKYASIYEFDIFNNTNWEWNFTKILRRWNRVGECHGEIYQKEFKMRFDPD